MCGDHKTVLSGTVRFQSTPHCTTTNTSPTHSRHHLYHPPQQQPITMSSNEATRSKPVKVIYQSLTIPIPDSFLVIDPLDAKPITAQKVNWRSTPLPEYDGSYAVVLDNVLSPSECDTLLQLAEDSVADRGASGTRTWRPALVNFGAGYEILRKEYRNSDRIVWDNQTVANRLWARCVRAEGIAEELAEVVEPWSPSASSRRGPQVDKKWHFSCVNQRMRFLKYEGGQFFRRESHLLFCLLFSVVVDTDDCSPLRWAVFVLR